MRSSKSRFPTDARAVLDPNEVHVKTTRRYNIIITLENFSAARCRFDDPLLMIISILDIYKPNSYRVYGAIAMYRIIHASSCVCLGNV